VKNTELAHQFDVTTVVGVSSPLEADVGDGTNGIGFVTEGRRELPGLLIVVLGPQQGAEEYAAE